MDRHEAGRMPSPHELVEHLKRKGVTFDLCSEEDAEDYLTRKCNFFKLSAYRKLYEKRAGGLRDGQYIDLDFGHLRLLASLDQQLREVLLLMTLDIEHFHKVRLLTFAGENDEEPYGIVRDYLGSLSRTSRAIRIHEFERSSWNPYTASLYEKYALDMPVWVFFELASFGTIVDFTAFSGNRWRLHNLRAAYHELKNVKTLRNACAHGSCIMNEIHIERSTPSTRPVATRNSKRALLHLGFTRHSIDKWAKSPRMSQIVSSLIEYDELVPEGRSRSRANDLLNRFTNDFGEVSALFPSDRPVGSSVGFILKLTRVLGFV